MSTDSLFRFNQQICSQEFICTFPHRHLFSSDKSSAKNLNHLLEPTDNGNMQHSTHTLTLESIYIKIGHSRRCTFNKLLLLFNNEVLLLLCFLLGLPGLPKYDADFLKHSDLQINQNNQLPEQSYRSSAPH